MQRLIPWLPFGPRSWPVAYLRGILWRGESQPEGILEALTLWEGTVAAGPRPISF